MRFNSCIIIVFLFLSVHIVQPLTWTTWMASGLQPQMQHSSAIKSGSMYVTGGWTQVTSSLVLTNSALDRYSTTTPYNSYLDFSNVLPNGTYGGCLSYIASQNRLYYGGGKIDASNLTASRIVSIDAGSGSSSEIYPPVTIGEFLTCTLDNANCINIFGGRPTPTTHLIYCPSTSTWITNSSTPIAFSEHGSLKGYDGRLYVFGGLGSDGLPQNATYIFDPSTYQWSVGPSLPNRIAGFAYSGTPDGAYFYVIGGYDPAGQVLNSVYIFDVVQQMWTKDSTNYPYSVKYAQSQIDNNNVFVLDGQLPNGTIVLARQRAPIPASPSPTASPSMTPTPSVTPSASTSPSMSPSSTPSVTPSLTPSVTPTNSPTASVTPSVTPTNSPSPSPSNSATPPTSTAPSSSVTPSSSVPPDNSKNKKDSTATVAGAAGGGAVVGLAIVGAVLFLVIRKKNNQRKQDLPPKDAKNNDDVEMQQQGTTYAPINLSPQTSRQSLGSINVSNGSTGSDEGRHRTSSSKILALINKQNDWILDFNELQLGKRIGAGAFGEVYRASWRGIDVAVKKMKFKDSDDNETDEDEHDLDIQEFFAEAELMKKLRPHSNITQLFGVCAHPMCIITEFVPNGNLSSWLLNQARDIDDVAKVRIARGIAAGMLHLHTEGVIHRDLAARNILLDVNLNPKVSDFGMSRVALEGQSNTTESNIGPIKWMAPEALLEQVYNKKTDVWSYGVVLYEILSRKLPYENQNLVQTANQVSLGKSKLVEEIIANEKIYPAVLVTTMTACLRFDPNERPEFSDIVKMLQPSDD